MLCSVLHIQELILRRECLYEKHENVILLVVCFIFLSGCNEVNEDEVQKYIKENTESMLL